MDNMKIAGTAANVIGTLAVGAGALFGGDDGKQLADLKNQAKYIEITEKASERERDSKKDEKKK